MFTSVESLYKWLIRQQQADKCRAGLQCTVHVGADRCDNNVGRQKSALGIHV